MKCKNCGNEVSGGNVFCPVCSALLPKQHNSKLFELFSKLKASVGGKARLAHEFLFIIIFALILYYS